jgi:uncharacterized phage protein gp47/JayE
MSLSLDQLLTPTTEEEALTTALAFLDDLGFSASSWQSGSLPRALVQLVARFYSDLTYTRVTLTKSRFNDSAQGDFLDLYSDDAYDNQRIAAVYTEITLVLDDTTSHVGPFTIAVNQLVAQDSGGYTYRNLTGGTLANGGTLTLTFKAEQAGSGPIPPLGLGIPLITPLAGLPDPIVQAITVVGAEKEDDTKLQTRNRAKWATLSVHAPADAYKAWALAADPSVTRVYINNLNPRGPDTIDIYIAGATNPLPPIVATNVLAYIEPRRGIGADVAVLNAVTIDVNIVGTLYVAASYDVDHVSNAVEAALELAFDAMPVGGDGGVVQLATLYTTIMPVPGVRNVHILLPSGDVAIGPTQIPIPVVTLPTLLV